MTIARQFYTLVVVPFVLVIVFAVGLAFQFAQLSFRGARLINDLQRSATLNQELARANAEQSGQLRRQLEHVDVSFPETARALAYALGEKYTEYLRLDIDQRERIAVERIKLRQSEMSVLSMQVYEQLRAGRRAEAAGRLDLLYRLEAEIRDEFQALNGLQLGRLRGVVVGLNQAAFSGFVAIGVLVGAMVFVMGASTLLVRRRILKPVHALLAASDRIRESDLTARVAVERTDELGRLTQGFNFMADSLAETYAGLERRVAERTRQLQDAQRQLVQAEKMSAVGLLVSSVAHELNNPLATIMGFAELAKMELSAGGTTARAVKLLEDVDVQVERCRRIVANLLQFSRKEEPHLEEVGINQVVEQVLRLREHDLAIRKITLRREFDPGNPVLRADPDKIRQVTLNLLNNAHDAISETGRPGTIWVRTRTEADTVIVEFLDDGPGFCDVERAFDPFYTTKEPGKGTGLGLSVCYGIVQEHRGSIVARNWERGAQVIVTLPAGEARQAERHEPSTPGLPLQGTAGAPVHALVVDDEETLLRLQASFLAKAGITSGRASTGEEAIRYLQDHHVDLVISDVRMPGAVDGLQLYEWVQRHLPQLAGRFIFVSGDLVEMNLGAFFARTGAPCLEKPFRYEKYARSIRKVLESGGRLP